MHYRPMYAFSGYPNHLFSSSLHDKVIINNGSNGSSQLRTAVYSVIFESTYCLFVPNYYNRVSQIMRLGLIILLHLITPHASRCMVSQNVIDKKLLHIFRTITHLYHRISQILPCRIFSSQTYRKAKMNSQ